MIWAGILSVNRKTSEGEFSHVSKHNHKKITLINLMHFKLDQQLSKA